MMRKKPYIGLTIDGQNPKTSDFAKQYSEFYWYAQRSACIHAIIAHGGVPILLPHDLSIIENYVDLVDGLIISGGGHDTPPEYFNEQPHPKERIKIERSEFEKEFFLSFVKTKKPILGICGGMQLIAALCGGKIYQYLPDEGCFQEHSQNTSPDKVFHQVRCVENTKLYDIFDHPKYKIWVNSVHQQGVKTLGTLTATAYSDDGLIEAFEDENHPFCIGVQWHPEFLITPHDQLLMKHFIQSAQDFS